MNEEDWLNGTNPDLMLGYSSTRDKRPSEWVPLMREREKLLGIQSRADCNEVLAQQGGGRKLLLYGVACCRRIWSIVLDQRSRKAIKVAERYADGLASVKDRRAAGSAAYTAWTETWETYNEAIRNPSASSHEILSLHHALNAVFPLAGVGFSWGIIGAVRTGEEICRAVGSWLGNDRIATEVEEQNEQCHLLRDIFGNPFRPANLEPIWLLSRVVSLAKAAYKERSLPAGTLDPDRLAILADALEDAGCTDTDILSHLRGPGPHVRGCWVVDLLLAKS